MFKSSLFLAILGLVLCTLISGIIYFIFAERFSMQEAWVHSEINYSNWTFYVILVCTVAAFLSPVIFLSTIQKIKYWAIGFMIFLTLLIYSNLVWVAWVAYYQNGGPTDGKYGSIYHLLLLLLTSYSLFSLSDRYLFQAPWWLGILLIPILYFINSPFTPNYLSIWLPLSFGLLSLFMMTYAQPLQRSDREDILDDLK